MAPRERPAARAVVLSPERRVLPMKFRFPWREGELWITPGGALRSGEDVRAALFRELREETGLLAPEVKAELWTRHHPLTVGAREYLLQERYFLVPMDEFEPRATALDEGSEADWFRGFRWWGVDELPDVSDEFAPTRLGELLRTLLRDGPPSAPFAIPV